MVNNDILRVVGDRLYQGDGEVVLRGVGVGGVLNLENYIGGFAGTESQMRRAFRRVVGDETYESFFTRYETAFFDRADAEYIASLGMNCVRVPINYRIFEDDMAPFELREEGFQKLDRVIEVAAASGLSTIIDLHSLPGAQNQHWHSDNPTHWAHFWTHRHFQDRVVHLWEALADRYKGNAWVAGYNPINEPGDASGERVGPFYRRLEAAIRAIDPDHILFLDGNTYSTRFDQLGDPLPNSVYAAHDYSIAGLFDAGHYPGVTRGVHMDKAALEETFLARTQYMRQTGTPTWIGEFGPVYRGTLYTGDPVDDARADDSRYQVLLDQIEIYNEHHASWHLWTYKDIGIHGVVSLDPASPYMRQIEAVIEKKARLGVDHWGSSDDGIRDVIGPYERLMDDEFPDFEPYPWGRRQWIHDTARHTILGEAMVDDFAQAFEGVDAARAEILAGSFGFDSTIKRDRLAETIRRGIT